MENFDASTTVIEAASVEDGYVRDLFDNFIRVVGAFETNTEANNGTTAEFMLELFHCKDKLSVEHHDTMEGWCARFISFVISILYSHIYAK
jgi:hypothetical protein